MNHIKALVVLSGGQDSATCLALAVKMFGPEHVAAITFDYGQRHAREINAAKQVAYLTGIQAPEVIKLGSEILKGTSPLTDKSATLEQYADFETMDKIIGDRVEKTFVPMRNALFLTIAANRAVVAGASQLWTGVCQADNANYPDCRSSFIDAQQLTILEALGASNPEGPPLIVTPLMFLSKADSLRLLKDRCGPDGYALLAFTHTAYDGQYPPVGKDHATVLRAEGFRQFHYPDPLVIRAHAEGLMPLPDSDNYKDSMVNQSVLEAIRRHAHKLWQGNLYESSMTRAVNEQVGGY